MAHWEAGDKAVCIQTGRVGIKTPNMGQLYFLGKGLEQDKIYHVRAVSVNPSGLEVLFLEEFPDERHAGTGSGDFKQWGGKLSLRFRKVLPDRNEGELDDWTKLFDQHKKKTPVPVPALPLLPYHGEPR